MDKTIFESELDKIVGISKEFGAEKVLLFAKKARISKIVDCERRYIYTK